MSLMITDACINCDMCLAECPNQAIFEGEQYYELDVDRCTECVGFYDHQTCVEVCPIECIVEHPDVRESQEQLLAKFKALRIV